ncbi:MULTISPECIES: sugar ABC transporter permease [unclassified Roseitalea]|uniref:carbohydrate ABC transporter permease n=1 Tax=unclassified Roseitalea TaxID=2639107 RepID=UPI00273F8644|nr:MULTISPECIES: sugar ABC transporter permease [unclassified Roseitalea]
MADTAAFTLPGSSIAGQARAERARRYAATLAATRKPSGGGWLMVAPLVVGLVVFAVYPLAYLIVLSFSESSLGRPLTEWVGFDNFAYALSGRFGDTLWRTVFFAVPLSLIQVALGVLVALLFNSAVRSGSLVRALILLPLMTPPVMVGVAWKLILNPTGGLVNGMLMSLGLTADPVSFLGTSPWAMLSIGLADTWQWTPFVAILAFAALQAIPEDVYEAARLDGATPVQIFVKVILPMLAPALAAIFLLRLIMAFKLFDLVYVLTSGGPGFDTNLSTYMIWETLFRDFDVGAASAQTLLFAITVGVVTLPVTWLHKQAEALNG